MSEVGPREVVLIGRALMQAARPLFLTHMHSGSANKGETHFLALTSTQHPSTMTSGTCPPVLNSLSLPGLIKVTLTGTREFRHLGKSLSSADISRWHSIIIHNKGKAVGFAILHLIFANQLCRG